MLIRLVWRGAADLKDVSRAVEVAHCSGIALKVAQLPLLGVIEG